MSIDTKHPQVTSMAPFWTQMQDTYEGEHAVKAKGLTYLPATEGMILDGMTNPNDVGYMTYQGYKTRAVFPHLVRQAVESMVGIMNREDARIEVPDALKPVVERMTIQGESIQLVLRRIQEWQLLYGRCGALVEVPDGQPVDKVRPYIALYAGPRIINWDDGIRATGLQQLEFVVLDESDTERTSNLEWEFANRWRICAMSETAALISKFDQSENTAAGEYMVAVTQKNDADIPQDSWKTPEMGGVRMKEIPFVFINTKDLVSSPDMPPLLSLSDLCLTIYRGEADYRRSLHMQTQETLVVIGAETDNKNIRTGAGARIDLPQNSDAKYIGVSADGLKELKASLDSDYERAGEQTTKLFDSPGTSYQSGDALRIRISAKTATLTSIVRTSAAAVHQLLVYMATWMGLSETEIAKIKVEPNTDFAETSTASRTVLELTQAKQMGAPVSQKDIHRFMERNDLTDMSFEESIEQIKGEEPLTLGLPAGIGGGASGLQGRATGGSRVARGVESGNDRVTNDNSNGPQ